MPGRGSSGPTRSTGPSAAAHSQPARTTTVARGWARRCTSLRVPPLATNPTPRAPVTGCGSTPAFTTEEWIVASARRVETTHRPASRPTSRWKSARSVTRRTIAWPAGLRPGQTRRARRERDVPNLTWEVRFGTSSFLAHRLRRRGRGGGHGIVRRTRWLRNAAAGSGGAALTGDTGRGGLMSMLSRAVVLPGFGEPLVVEEF